MAKVKNSNAKPGDNVELADKETSFYDPETQLNLSRDQVVEIEDRVGKKTNRALLSGRLLIVGSGRSKAKAKAADEDEGGPADDLDIPQDLPGREAFVAAGFTTFDSIKALDTEEKLLEVKGIGKGTVKNLAEYAKANGLTSEEG